MQPRFLRGDRHRVVAGRGIVRADLGADAILQRRDDLAARGVVLGVRAEDQQHVEPQPDRVALDLDVPFLQDVEQADLDLAGEVGQLVDREDAAVRPRQQAVVHRQLVGELQGGTGRLDRIEVADHVGDRHVGRGELLDVARVARQPGDGKAVAFRADARAARGTERRQRIVVDLAARHDRDRFIEQIRQRAEDAALRLPAQAEQDEVVAREDGVDDLRHHGLVVADDAGKYRLLRPQACDEVLADFVFDRTAHARGRPIPRRAVRQALRGVPRS